MLAPTPPQLLLAFFSKQEWRHLDFCWIFRWFLLPSVMDPSLHRLLGFFITKQTNNTIHMLVCHISPVEWHEFYSHLGFPPYCITKLYGEGLLSATTTSALFLLCTGYAVRKRDCCILCRRLSVQYLSWILCLPHCCRFSWISHSALSDLWEGCSTLVLIVWYEWKVARWCESCECVCVCVQVFYFNLHKSRVLVGSGACG